jgi:Predicted metal-binding, possibly nucleic acid-binding protein
MIVNLKKYFADEGFTDTVNHSFSVSGVKINGMEAFSKPISVEAVFKGKEEFVELALSLSFQIKAPCDRCLEVVEIDETVGFKHILVRELREEEHEDDLYICVENDTLNLEELAYDDVVLNLPTRILCREDCKGLCSGCGINLNRGSCECNTQAVDSRLEILKQLLDNKE